MPPLSFRPFFLTPLYVTLRDHHQLPQNPATLSLFPATLTSRVNHNPFVCRSYKKYPGVGSHPSSQSLRVAAALFPNPFVTRPAQVTDYQSPVTKSSTIRTSEKHTDNPFRIRTSKTKHSKLFRMNTYEKSPRGEGPNPALLTRMTPKPPERGCDHR